MPRLIRFELKKLLGKRAMLLVLVLFSLLNLAKIVMVYRDNSYLYQAGAGLSDWDSTYRSLYADYRGPITPERIEKLLRLFRPIEAQVAERTASTRTDDPGTMTGSLYSDYNLLRKYFVQPMQEYYSYGEKAAEAAAKARENADFYRVRGNGYEARKSALLYHQLAGRQIATFAYLEMANYYVHYDFSSALILLVCLYGLTGVFAREKESEMAGLLRTSPGGGRSTYAAKLAAAGLFLAGASLWFSFLDLGGFVLAFQSGEGFSMPIYAISNFAATPLNATVGWYAVLSALSRALGVWSMGMLFLLIARFGKNELFPFLAGLLACLGLVIAGTDHAGSGHAWAQVWNPFTLVQNRIVYSRSEFVNLLGFPIPSFAAALLAAALLGIFSAALNLVLSEKNKLCPGRRLRRAHDVSL